VSDVALAAFHACVIANDGALRCWGDNESGRLGDGTQAPRTPRNPTRTLPAVLEVRTLEAHSCARLADHTVRCWGGNAAGQLGDGTVSPRFTPAAVR
jgi:alpha-tubulin suppressor-like RCC1 family protein